MLQPRTADRAVQVGRERIEALAEGLDVVNRACLECAARLHLGGHIDEAHGQSRRHLLTAGGKKRLHGWFARRDAEDPETLHRPQA